MAKIKLPENSALSSRTKFLLRMLSNLKMPMALKAMNLMIEEMCAEKGFERESGAHYYHHLVDVAQKALNFDIRDEKIITVCILHDAIEDTWMTFEYIEREFGTEIAQAVQILSKDKNVDYKEDEEALHRYLISCYQTLCTAIAKTLDRVHNFGTLGATPLHKQLRVALETEANFFPLLKWAREEYPEYSALFHQAKTEIEPHLEKIKEQAAMKADFERQIAEKDAEIQRLREEIVAPKIQQMHDIVDASIEKDNHKAHLKEHLTTIKVLKKRNDIIESALGFYADKENHQSGLVRNDSGEKAAKALDPMSMFE